MSERRRRPGDAGIDDENIELAVALMQRRAETSDAIKIGEIERHQGRSSAVFPDLVVELFEAALRTCHRNHMRTQLCECARGGIADAARGAGDESDTGGKGKGHGERTYGTIASENQMVGRRDFDRLCGDVAGRQCRWQFAQNGMAAPSLRGSRIT